MVFRRQILGCFTGAAVALLGVAVVSPVAAQTPAPAAPQTTAPAAGSGAGCSYRATSATATGGSGMGGFRHLDDGQTVTNMASHVTYVCKNGKMMRQ